MATQVELLLEAERRGILPPDKAALLAEAKKRGLVSQSGTPPSKEWMERLQGPKPKESGLRDFLTGATGMVRGATNALTPSDLPMNENVARMRDLKVAGVLGERAAPVTQDNTRGYGDRVFHPEFADKSSGAYLAGALADPGAWAIGAGAAKAIPYAPVLKQGFVKGVEATAQNIAGGAVPGAIIGGLADEGRSDIGATVGAVLNMAIPPSIRILGVAGKKLWDGMHPVEKARNIMVDILGDDLPAFMAATANAANDVTTAQAASGIGNDLLNALEALVRRHANANDSRFFNSLDARQKQEVVDGLVALAGGRNKSEVLDTVARSKANLGGVTEPIAQEALGAANEAGRAQPRISALQQQAARLGEEASGRVGDARRLGRAGQTAETIANTGRMNQGGQPTPVLGREGLAVGNPPPYSRGAELVDVAERGGQKAATESLWLGAGARQSAAEAEKIASDLAARGLSPLDTAGVSSALRRMIKNPKIGPRDTNEKVLSAVADKIDEWTARGDGVIDAEALRVIRSDAVNDTIRSLSKSPDPKADAKIASHLLSKVKPLIDNAIESAGGKGWRNYLHSYEQGMRVINRQQMGGKALSLLDESPKKLEALEAENRPELVQKIFQTEYDLGRAMGNRAIQPIRRAAAYAERKRLMREGAARGDQAMLDVVAKHKANFLLPNWVSGKIALTNRFLKEVELRVNDKSFRALTDAMKSGANANKVLSIVPVEERGVVIKAMMNAQDSPKVRAFLSGYLSAQEQ